jgi:superfamily II DNA or RNA helicase
VRPAPPWVEWLRTQTPSWLRERGAEYHDAGMVTLDRADAFGLGGRVTGENEYQVEVDTQGGRRVMRCDCPYFTRSRSACKHLWAAALAWQRTAQALDAGEDLDDFEPDDLQDDLDELADLGRPLTWGPRPRPRPEAAPPLLPEWDRRLRHLEQALQFAQVPEPPPLTEPLLYVVDAGPAFTRGQLALDVLWTEKRRDGKPGKLKPFRPHGRHPSVLSDPTDRTIFATLGGALGGDPWAIHGQSPIPLPAEVARLVFPLASAEGRLVVRAGRDELRPVRWSDEPWRLRLQVDEEHGQLVATASLERAGAHKALSEPLVLLSAGFVVFPDEVAPFDHQGLFPWVAVLRQYGRLGIPREEGARLVAVLARAAERPVVTLPGGLTVGSSPAPRPHISFGTPAWPTDRHRVELAYLYGDVSVAWHEPGWAFVLDGALVPRDLAAERAAFARTTALGVRVQHYPGPSLDAARSQLPVLVRVLAEEGWSIEVEGRAHRGAGTLRLAVRSGIDWFDVEGELEFGDTALPLPELLRALRAGHDEVVLPDGSRGTITAEVRRRVLALAGHAPGASNALRFGRAQGPLLDALLATQPDVDLDAAFAKVRAALNRFGGVQALPTPAGFEGTLRPYQQEGLGWMAFLREFGFGGVLADDMGLGKTIQVLALLLSRRSGSKRPSLVVVPRSLVFNWKEEAARFAPRLRVVDHSHAGRARAGLKFRAGDVVLATYGTLRRDAAELSTVEFDYVVLDEAQAVKNEGTASARAARLLKAGHRLALSGTPVENHLGELRSILQFLNPGLLDGSKLLERGTERDPESLAVLARLLRPFVLRRTKEAVATDLPPRTEQVLRCPLEPTQRRLYDELREHYRAALLPRVERDGMKKAAMHVLEALLRLRQAACHPGLLDPARAGELGAKFEALLPRLAEIREEGHKAVVFSQFTTLLALLRKQLDAQDVSYAYLDGRTRDRAAAVKRFQEDPACPLFLVSLKAGGVGLNLTAAEYVFVLDPWWNPAVEAQAIDRAHRIGQERAVFAYRLLAEDTVEDKIHALQDRKRALARAVIGEDAAPLASLRREDLELLLS